MEASPAARYSPFLTTSCSIKQAICISLTPAIIASVRLPLRVHLFRRHPSTYLFSYTIGGSAPASQTMSVSSSAAALSFTASVSTTSGGNWLTVNPVSGTTPSSLTVSVSPSGLPGGVYQGAITITPAGASAQSFAVSLTVTGAGAPSFTAAGIVNATGYQNKLAPDTVFTIFGSGMGPSSLVAATGPNYPTSLGGTSITFTPATGGQPINAKLVYSVAGQVAGLLPSSIAPGTYAVRLTYNTLVSAPQNVTVASRSFGIATSNSAGSGTAQATIGNVNGGVSLTRFTSGSLAYNGLNWTLSPSHPGDTVVLWGTRRRCRCRERYRRYLRRPNSDRRFFG